MIPIRPHDVILFFDPSKEELSLASVQYVENGQCIAVTLEGESVIIYNHCINEVVERERLTTVLENFPANKLLNAEKFLKRAFSEHIAVSVGSRRPPSNLRLRIVRDDEKWRAGQP